MTRQLRLAALALAAMGVVTTPATAQRRQAVTSAYTNLDLDRCQELRDEPEEVASARWRCPGYRGIPLMVELGDERIDVDAGRFNGEFESTSAFSSEPDRVEWRLRGGRPFAIIYRLRVTPHEQTPRSVLAVEKIGTNGRPGCLIAWIDGRTPDANAVARQQADAHAANFRCGTDRLRQIGEAA